MFVLLSFLDDTAPRAGVEWDDPARGKNDGSLVDETGVRVRYFTCAPGRGSLVRPECLRAAPEAGPRDEVAGEASARVTPVCALCGFDLCHNVVLIILGALCV